MDELKRAISAAGGVTALARLLGISQSRVSNWLTRESVPDGWLVVLRMKFPEGATDAHAAQAAQQGATHA